jgi:hypothetical protein
MQVGFYNFPKNYYPKTESLCFLLSQDSGVTVNTSGVPPVS